MRSAGIILLALFTSSGFGQQSRKIIVKYPNSNDVKEVYFVLRSDNRIKSGDYFSFYKGQRMGFKETGKYQNGAKTGKWIYYKAPNNLNGQIINTKLEEGEYQQDQKIGIWEICKEEGMVITRYDFDIKKELDPTISTVFSYPSEAKERGVEGVVTIKVGYNSCEPTSYEIISDIGYGCGNAVIKSLKKQHLLQKKYGAVKINCDKLSDTLKFNFRLSE